MNRYASMLAGVAVLLFSSVRLYASDPVPVVVELFTSEGCSSCPPADLLLQKFDQQPIAGAKLIVLSEHVDYWNHDGWKDPYSSPVMTERQKSYATAFRLHTVYTPQMVVDGRRECSGANAQQAQQAISESLSQRKLDLRLSDVSLQGSELKAKLETGALDKSYGAKAADVYVVIALDHAESQVLRGENANRHLTHTAVVEKVQKVGKIKVGGQFAHEIQVKLEPGSDPRNLRLVAFLQDPDSGKVVGATMNTVPSGSNP